MKQSADILVIPIPTEKYLDELSEGEFHFNNDSIVETINVTTL